MIPKDVVMVVHDHQICELADVANALKDALLNFLIQCVSGRTRQIDHRLIFKVTDARAILRTRTAGTGDHNLQ